jgi:PBSX family phage terminase large subunit
MNQQYLNSLKNPTCPHCKLGTLELPSNGQEWHVECDECNLILLTYDPMKHQKAFHSDPHKYKMFAGGYGSAKTTTACAEIIKHVLATPRGTTLIGAATNPQLEQTAEKQFFEMFPEPLIKFRSLQKKYIDTIHGHRVLFRPLDQEGKARSLNLSAFWIEEASEVAYEYFVQLQTRLRSKATDHHLGLLSTNPDLNWIRTEILLKSDKIYNAEENYHQVPEDINPLIVTHIAPTELNTHLPPTYYEDTARGKPEWWTRRYLRGSFSHAEGQVYPMFNEHIIEPFQIPQNWERMQASDFGLRDPTVALWGAIDPETATLYIYDEHYEAEKPIHYHAEKMNERLDTIPFGRLRFLVGDPKGKSKSEKDMKSVFNYYEEYGIYFEPAINKIEDGIMKVFNYFSLNKVKIFSSCVNLVREGINYKYPNPSLTSDKNLTEIPIDKDNHAMDSLKYLIAELPDNPLDLLNKSYGYGNSTYKSNNDHLPHALQEEHSDESQEWQNYYSFIPFFIMILTN